MANKWFDDTFLPSVFKWVGVGKDKYLTAKQTQVCIKNMNDIVFSYSPNGIDKYMAVRYEYEWRGRTVHLRYSKLNGCGTIYFTATAEEAAENHKKYLENKAARERDFLLKAPDALRKRIDKLETKLQKEKEELGKLRDLDEPDEFDLEDITFCTEEIHELEKKMNFYLSIKQEIST